MKTLKFMSMLAAAVAAGASQADVDSYLYWMAGDTIKNQFTGKTIDYSYVKVNFGGTVSDANFTNTYEEPK